MSALWNDFPICLEIVEITVPNNLDGISFVPTVLQYENPKKHDCQYWEFHKKKKGAPLENGD